MLSNQKVASSSLKVYLYTNIIIAMKKISRRSFIKTGALAGGAAILASNLHPFSLRGSTLFNPPDIYSISGDDIWQNIPKLLEATGGIGNLISSGNSVGLLVNSPWKHVGFYTNPDIPIAVANACLEAGASKIIVFKPVPDGYWEKGNLYKKHWSLVNSFSYSDERVEKEIEGGQELKTVEIFKDFLDVDVFINIPVAKHHAGTLFSGMLKNLMGATSSHTNRHMHSPDGEYTYAKKEYLSKCIADLGLLRKPDLCIMDTIECGLNNGPRGPSETSKPGKILLSTDPVAMDVYSSDLAGFYAEDILTSEFAGDLGLGKSHLEEISVLEL
jgi:uncharacterized protein (DUF362 family)